MRRIATKYRFIERANGSKFVRFRLPCGQFSCDVNGTADEWDWLFPTYCMDGDCGVVLEVARDVIAADSEFILVQLPMTL